MSARVDQPSPVIPYLSMLQDFANHMGRPDLSAEERMDTWVALMRQLRRSPQK